MKKDKRPTTQLFSLKQLVHKFPQRFPVYYHTLDEDRVDTNAPDLNFFEKYAQCSAYRSKGYFVFMHHFPISKPELSNE